MAWSAPSHYLNQGWNIVNLTLGNKLQWNLNRSLYIFIQENAFESVVWKMVAILSRPQCVKGHAKGHANWLFSCVYWPEALAPFQYPIRCFIVRSQSREIGNLNYRITLKFDRHISSTAAEVPVKFQSDCTIPNTNLKRLFRLCEILQ